MWKSFKKNVLFWPLMIPLGIIAWLLMWVHAAYSALYATAAVISNLCERLEYWLCSVPADYFYNTPYRKTIWQVWKDAFDEVIGV